MFPADKEVKLVLLSLVKRNCFSLSLFMMGIQSSYKFYKRWPESRFQTIIASIQGWANCIHFFVNKVHS